MRPRECSPVCTISRRATASIPNHCTSRGEKLAELFEEQGDLESRKLDKRICGLGTEPESAMGTTEAEEVPNSTRNDEEDWTSDDDDNDEEINFEEEVFECPAQ